RDRARNGRLPRPGAVGALVRRRHPGGHLQPWLHSVPLPRGPTALRGAAVRVVGSEAARARGDATPADYGRSLGGSRGRRGPPRPDAGQIPRRPVRAARRGGLGAGTLFPGPSFGPTHFP